MIVNSGNFLQTTKCISISTVKSVQKQILFFTIAPTEIGCVLMASLEHWILLRNSPSVPRGQELIHSWLSSTHQPDEKRCFACLSSLPSKSFPHLFPGPPTLHASLFLCTCHPLEQLWFRAEMRINYIHFFNRPLIRLPGQLVHWGSPAGSARFGVCMTLIGWDSLRAFKRCILAYEKAGVSQTECRVIENRHIEKKIWICMGKAFE